MDADRRFAVVQSIYRGISLETRRDGTLLPCVEMREDPAGRYYDVAEAFRAGKRMAGWNAESGGQRPTLAEEAERLGSTAGALRDRYRPATPTVAAALREAAEAFPDEPPPEEP